MILKAVLLIVVGSAVAGAVIAGAVTVAVFSAVVGETVPRGFWWSSVVFVGLSTVLATVGFRAFRRELRKPEGQRRSMLALAFPVLFGGGIIFGVCAGIKVSAGRVETLRQARLSDCKLVYGHPSSRDLAEAQKELCLPLARACQRARYPDVMRPGEQLALANRWPRGVRMPTSLRSRREVDCLIQALRATGQYEPPPRRPASARRSGRRLVVSGLWIQRLLSCAPPTRRSR